MGFLAQPSFTAREDGSAQRHVPLAQRSAQGVENGEAGPDVGKGEQLKTACYLTVREQLVEGTHQEGSLPNTGDARPEPSGGTLVSQ